MIFCFIYLDQRSTLKRTFISTHPESISYISCICILSRIKNQFYITLVSVVEINKKIIPTVQVRVQPLRSTLNINKKRRSINNASPLWDSKSATKNNTIIRDLLQETMVLAASPSGNSTSLGIRSFPLAQWYGT